MAKFIAFLIFLILGAPVVYNFVYMGRLNPQLGVNITLILGAALSAVLFRGIHPLSIQGLVYVGAAFVWLAINQAAPQEYYTTVSGVLPLTAVITLFAKGLLRTLKT
jgi:hypothetical protein